MSTKVVRETYSIGIDSHIQTQPIVHLYFTLQTAREDARNRVKRGEKVLWLTNINTGREHRF